MATRFTTYLPARKRRTFLRDLGIADLTDAVLIGGSIFFIMAALYVWVPFLAGRVS